MASGESNHTRHSDPFFNLMANPGPLLDLIIGKLFMATITLDILSMESMAANCQHDMTWS